MVDERAVIGAILGSLKRLGEVGDDVALAPRGEGNLVVKVDVLVGRTDVPPRMTYRQAARKAVAACVSDFAAKGARPDSFVVSVGVRKGVSKAMAVGLGLGFADAEREWGVKLVGGDTNETEGLVIDVAMFGWGKKVVRRSGAVIGDALVVTGKFGMPPAGLKVLMEGAKATARFRRAALKSVLAPTPNLRAGLALSRYLTSSMDSSDGLARSLHTLAEASGVGFEVTNLPAAGGVREFAALNGIDWQKLVLEGGEEYLVVGTMKEADLADARRSVEQAGGGLYMIGRATSPAGEVLLRTKGSSRKIRDFGWTHLR